MRIVIHIFWNCKMEKLVLACYTYLIVRRIALSYWICVEDCKLGELVILLRLSYFLHIDNTLGLIPVAETLKIKPVVRNRNDDSIYFFGVIRCPYLEFIILNTFVISLYYSKFVVLYEISAHLLYFAFLKF